MHHNTPPLSVLLASYNGERYIEEQLKSIAAQTYTDFQLIICDDNSQDETVRIIEKFRAKHPRIVLHQNTTTLGYVKNFEKLIGLCHTPYMALCDQDDIWKPDKLEKQMQYMHMTEAENKTVPVLIHSDLSVHNANGTQLHPSYFAYRGYALGSKKDLGHILGPCGVMGNTILFNQALKKLILPFPPMLTGCIPIMQAIHRLRFLPGNIICNSTCNACAATAAFPTPIPGVKQSFSTFLTTMLSRRKQKIPLKHFYAIYVNKVAGAAVFML